MRRLITLTAVAVLMFASVAPAIAQTVAMTVDRFKGTVTVFDADNDVILGTVVIPGGALGIADCSILADQSLGFVSSFSPPQIWVIDLTGGPTLAGGTNPIPVSDEAIDNTITLDQQFLLASGRDDQISIVDIASRSEIAPFVAPNRSRFFTSVETCSDGSILATDFLNGRVDRLTIDSSGTLAPTGESMPPIRAINAACAPDAASAIGVRTGFTFLPPIGLIRSALIPGLATVDDRVLPGQGISAVINSAGNRVFVRSTTPMIGPSSPFGTVDAYSYNSATGALGATPSLSFRVDTTSGFFGVDQLALHPDDTKLYVPELFELNVYDASTGAKLKSIGDRSIFFRPEGVCFAAQEAGEPILSKEITSGPQNIVVPDSITFETLNTLCGRPSTFEFFLNGVSLGTAAADPANTCTCAAPIDTFAVTDAALIASAWNVAGNNDFRFVKNGISFVSWTRVEVQAGAQSETVCVFDFNGGNCDVTNLCSASSTTVSLDRTTRIADPFSGPIDVVIEVGQLSTTKYDFEITFTNPGGADVLVVDTVPAEWNVIEIEGQPVSPGNGPDNADTVSGAFGTVDVFHPGQGATSSSAVRLKWTPDPTVVVSDIRVDAETTQNPGKGNVKFAPTSCGPLVLNNGAVAFEIDPITGEIVLDDELNPVVVAGPTDPLILVAVEDLDGGGVKPDGSGDEDGDGLTDADEALNLGTDPCLVDTDGDGVNDNLDQCSLQGTEVLGAVDGNGCPIAP